MSKPPTISFEAPKDVVALIGLGIDMSSLASLAFDEYLAWLLGTRRPTTISEIEVERLYKIFRDASGEGSKLQLNEEYLIGRLRFPVGRVRYLVSAVRKMHPDVMSPMIKEALAELDKATSTQEQESRIKFSVPEEIAYILREIAKQGKWELQSFKLSMPGYGRFTVEMSNGLKSNLSAALKNYLGQ